MRPLLPTLLALAAAPLAAQQLPKEPPGAQEVSRITAGTYRINPEHSQVLFTVNNFGFSEYAGQFTGPSGTLTLDPAKPQDAKLVVSVPIAGVSTTVPALNANLQKPQFFNAAKFPAARFVSTRVDVTGTHGFIAGQLTLHGVTRPIVIAIRFVGAGQGVVSHKTNIGFTGTATIQRGDFGLTTLVPLVSDRVSLTINALFEAR